MEGGLSSSEIMRIVREIQNSHLSEEQRKGFYSKRYVKFSECYKVLFDMACRPGIDMKKLEYMLTMREKVVKGTMSVDNASKHVGQTMFDEYVKPIVGDLPPTNSIQGDYEVTEITDEKLV